jgi:hypothetical protein
MGEGADGGGGDGGLKGEKKKMREMRVKKEGRRLAQRLVYGSLWVRDIIYVGGQYAYARAARA